MGAIPTLGRKASIRGAILNPTALNVKGDFFRGVGVYPTLRGGEKRSGWCGRWREQACVSNRACWHPSLHTRVAPRAANAGLNHFPLACCGGRG